MIVYYSILIVFNRYLPGKLKNIYNISTLDITNVSIIKTI